MRESSRITKAYRTYDDMLTQHGASLDAVDIPRHGTHLVMHHYRCPKCVGTLSLANDGLFCAQCMLAFPIRGGIVDFRCGRHDYYFNPVPAAAMDRLTENATRETWPSTIRSFLSQVGFNSGWLDNLVTDGRYAWKLMLDLNRDTVLLDLGCGLGNLTKNLAPHIAQVYAMDLTYGRLEFARKRFEIFNARDSINLLAAGDAEHLPFASGSLDCVALSGVLEWVGEGETSVFATGSKSKRLFQMLRYHFGRYGARAIQLRFLKEIRRILKQGGQLYLSIENRLNWQYFTGRPDHHSNLKFASLLPRFVANLYSILINRAPYRTYTYSIPGYRRLLKDAGFQTIEFLGLAPGYSFLEEMQPLEGHFPKWAPEFPKGIKNTIKRCKYFVPAYGVIAGTAPEPRPRMQDAVLAEVERAVGKGPICISRYHITDKDKVVMLGSAAGFGIVIKIPCNAAATRQEKNGHHLLECLIKVSNVYELIQRPLAEGEVVGMRFFAETRVAGEPLLRVLVARGRTAMLNDISSLLARLSRTSQTHMLTGDLYDTHVTRHVTALHEIIDDSETQRRLAEFFRSRLYGIQVAVGIAHGDFGVNNIFCTGGTITGLIDWEAGGMARLPVLDAVNYVGSVQRLFDKKSYIGEIVPRLASGVWPVTEETEFLKTHYARCGVDPKHHQAIVYLDWLHAVSFRLQYRLAFDPPGIDRFVKPVVESILEARPFHLTSTYTDHPQ